MNKCAFCEGHKRFIAEAKEQNKDTYMVLSACFSNKEGSQIFKINYCPSCGRKLNET